MTDALLSWLGSYLLHSTVLIGGLWVVERAGGLARLGLATQEALWRVALLGGLLSASLPLLPLSAPAADASAVQVGPLVAARVVPMAPPAEPAEPVAQRISAVAAPADRGPVATAPRASLPLDARQAPQLLDLALGGTAVWLGGALLGLAVLAVQWLWLRRSVSRLPAVSDARWQARLAGMAARLGVPQPALRHAHSGWASPLLAPGRVLCLPGWCLDLDDEEARAVLGHELAHLRRRDPAWRLLAAVLRALLWPQALNRVALRRLDLLAELACDSAAAAPAGLRLALAQSLLRCAEALAPGGRHGPALACGAASAGSPLRARVRRLLGTEGDEPRDRRVLRWGLLATLLGLLVALPAVVVSHTDAGSLRERFDLAEALDMGDLLHGGSEARIVNRSPLGSFSVRLSGKARFTDEEDEVQSLDGRLVVRERQGLVQREMTLTSHPGGRIERTYRVAGEVAELDEAGRQWWAQAIRRVAQTLTDPDVHARQLLAHGGVAAVLADLARADEDDLRRRRIVAAVRLGQPLDAAAQLQLIAAAAHIQGDFERREALGAIAGLALAAPQQAAWLNAAAQMGGDFERREALAALAPQLAPTPEVLQAWQAVLAGMGGDFERRTAIETQVAATPQAVVLQSALQAAEHLQGDFEKRTALGAVAQRLHGDDPGLVQAYLRVAGSVQGEFEKREALSLLLDRDALGPAGLEQVIAVAEGMDAGFERLQVLLRVADKLAQAQGQAPVTALVSRLRRAGRGLGDFERGQLEKSLDRLG